MGNQSYFKCPNRPVMISNTVSEIYKIIFENLEAEVISVIVCVLFAPVDITKEKFQDFLSAEEQNIFSVCSNIASADKLIDTLKKFYNVPDTVKVYVYRDYGIDTKDDTYRQSSLEEIDCGIDKKWIDVVGNVLLDGKSKVI